MRREPYTFCVGIEGGELALLAGFAEGRLLAVMPMGLKPDIVASALQRSRAMGLSTP